MIPRPLPRSDLEHVLSLTAPLWEEARGARFFITGGTGFFGCWLLESLLYANRALQLGSKVAVLTRDPDRFKHKSPHLAAAPELELLAGDIATLTPSSERFDYAFHVATETRSNYGIVDPVTLFWSNIEGTRRFLDFVRAAGVRKFLFTSSGAVYGAQPVDVPLLLESDLRAPDPVDPRSAYGESKRASEMLCALASMPGVCEGRVARCFAFVGPLLALDANYAIGNLIGDAMSGGPLKIGGDGTPRRSYLYASDLATWLWTILFRGQSGRLYNVGSEDHLSIRDLAEKVRSLVAPTARIEMGRQPVLGSPANLYIPSTNRARQELGLAVRIPLDDAILRTVAWHRSSV
jgi:nucleoside-diphosphate-sugar epimerase